MIYVDSMEEASALANSVGILAKKVLGTYRCSFVLTWNAQLILFSLC